MENNVVHRPAGRRAPPVVRDHPRDTGTGIGSVDPPALSAATDMPAAAILAVVDSEAPVDRRAPGLPCGSEEFKCELARSVTQVSDLLRDVRILIVDDCHLYRENLAQVLMSHGASCCSTAWDVRSLITAIDSSGPRIMLLNISTRGHAALLRQALHFGPDLRVVVTGVAEDDEAEIISCAEAGVAAYHMRTDSIEDLIALVNRVAAGEVSCPPRVAALLVHRLSSLAVNRQPPKAEMVLTAREAQILKMLELGLSNREIAAQLYIAVHTVKNHVHSLLTKLNVSTRAQAATYARDSI